MQIAQCASSIDTQSSAKLHIPFRLSLNVPRTLNTQTGESDFSTLTECHIMHAYFSVALISYALRKKCLLFVTMIIRTETFTTNRDQEKIYFSLLNASVALVMIILHVAVTLFLR